MRRSPLLLGAVALLVGVAACSDDAESTPELEASLSPHAVSATSAVLELTTDADDVAVEVRGEEGSFDVPVDDAGEPIPLVGMRPSSDYEVVVTAGGQEVVLEHTTGELPADFPPLSLDVNDADRRQDGVTVFNVMPFSPVPEGSPPPDAGWIVAVDGDGEVVWYHRMTHQLLDVDTTSRGTFIVSASEINVVEVDLLGRTVKDWAGRIATDGRGTDVQGRSLVSEDSQPVEIDSAHHEVTELPNGNTLTLSTELLEISPDDAARLCPENPGTNLIGDIVVELDPEGEVVQEWKLSDIYDPVERPGAELCLPQLPIAPPMWFYPEADDVRDWTHANAIALDEERNELLVSLRHLNAIVALRYHEDDDGPAGELLWELGPDGTIELAEGGEHLSHQHAVELVGDDELLVYDNGNYKGPPPYSRAVLYRLDRAAGTAEQVWEHRDVTPEGTPMFTAFLGDVDMLANGNVLVTHGGAAARPGDLTSLHGRIVEVERESDEVVWDLTVGDRQANAWAIYRAERHPSLYDLGG